MHAKLGFDFYGHGNVGDDLMLAGFLEVWNARKPLFCVVSEEQRKILRFRFPEVEWMVPGESLPSYDLWVGVGDTPIQVLSGLGFLEYLERELLQSLPAGIPAVLVGIGVEREAVSQRARFKAVLDRVSLISTRDETSLEILVSQFGVDPARIILGEDLSHIFLQKAFALAPKADIRPLSLAVNFYGEKAGRLQWLAVHGWLQNQAAERTVSALANESRLFSGSEAWRYAELSWLLFLRRPRRPVVPLYVPNRWAPTVGDLVAHFPAIETVLSSRYHCLLAASWAGCKVGALSRSSKIEALTLQLGLLSARAPFSSKNLEELRRGAEPVAAEKLSKLATRAAESTRKTLGLKQAQGN